MPNDVDKIVIDLRFRLDLFDVRKHQIVLDVTLGSIDHQWLILSKLQLHFGFPLLWEIVSDRVIEEVVPIDAFFNVCSQHAFKDVFELFTYFYFGGED
jgi:hypothetical protein